MDANYFGTPHGDRPPSAKAVSAQTLRYCRAEAAAMLKRPLDDNEVQCYNAFSARMVGQYGANWFNDSPGGPTRTAGTGRERA